MPNVIDLFAGAGGLSLGAARAGFNVIAAVELDSHAMATHRANFPNTCHVQRDIMGISGAELIDIIGMPAEEIVGIIGGPPCQGFSTIGHGNVDDKRNRLFERFFEIVSELQPAFFLAENVPGIMNSKYDEIRARAFEHVKQYHILPPIKINAAEYGAATTRTRFFFIGFRDDLRIDAISVEDIERMKVDPKSITTVEKALEGLPSDIEYHEDCDGIRRIASDYLDAANPHQQSAFFYDRVTKLRPQDIGDSQYIESYEKEQLVNGFLPTRHNEEVKRRYAAMKVRQLCVDPDESVLDDAMQALSDEEQNLIRLHHEHGYSIKEISAATGKSEDVLKMRLYRARKHLQTILITLLILVLMACAAVGAGMIDVNWFLQNRRAEPAVIENPMMPKFVSVEYPGGMLDVSVSDAVWNPDELTVTFVYSIAGKDGHALVVYGGNIGVDGMRLDHVWTDDGIIPVPQWADGKPVRTFFIDDWHLGGQHLTGRTDDVPDGLGETFMTELDLDWIGPERYEMLLDEKGMLAFEAKLTLEDFQTGDVLEAQNVIIRLDAPAAQIWRNKYEAYDR